jgi:hypothetical protein
MSIGVGISELMPTDAMRLARVDSSEADTAQQIHFVGYWFEMIRSDARAVATQMIERETDRHRSVDRLPQPLVREHVDALHSESSVSVDCGRGPDPAVFGLLDLREEAFLCRLHPASL